jgi:hypothetical protein
MGASGCPSVADWIHRRAAEDAERASGFTTEITEDTEDGIGNSGRAALLFVVVHLRILRARSVV